MCLLLKSVIIKFFFLGDLGLDSLDCTHFSPVSTATALTAYFPSMPNDGDGDTIVDNRGQPLQTLQVSTLILNNI